MTIGLGDIIAIISSVTAAVFAAGTYFKGLRHDKRMHTLDAFNRLQEQALDKLYMKKPSEIKQLTEHTFSHSYKEISIYIALIEHFCTGVNLGIYDRKTTYLLAHGFLDGAIKERIIPVLEKKNRDGNEYYENTKKVLEWMENKTEKEKNKK